jgi:nitroreductase
MTEQIVSRRSFSTFLNEPLSEEIIERLVDFLSGLTPPVPDIDWNFDTLPYLDLMRISRSEPGVRAPHYLLLRAERKNFSLQNSGYVGEMAALFLTGLGVATRWQGSIAVSAQDDFPDSLPYVAALAFGMSEEPFRTSAAEADRLPLTKIAYGKYERFLPMLEAARLAPSAFNLQPCSYVADDRGRLHVYRKKPFLNNPRTSYVQCIDSGAALAHLELAANDLGLQPVLTRMTPEPAFRTFIYQASLQFAQ